MLPPTHRQSTRRLPSTGTTRSIRFAVLIALIAVAGTALATGSSSASSLSRIFLARAASVFPGASAKATQVDEALETEDVQLDDADWASQSHGHAPCGWSCVDRRW